MKKITFTLLAVFIVTAIFSQEIPRELLQDSIIGWMKVYHFKGVKEPLKVDAKTYSAAQLSIGDSLANWIQASYIPKGGLGDVIRSVSAKLNDYNQNTAAIPQSYGAYAKIYTDLKYNSTHKMVPLDNSHFVWSIMANRQCGEPIDVLCTPTQYYFIMPSFEEQGYGEETDKIYDISNHSLTKHYSTYLQRNSVTGNQRNVIFFKDHKSPFIKITKGEYLREVEAAVARRYEKEKKEIYENKSNTQQNIDYFMKYLNDKNDRRIQCLNNNKEKYKDRLQETAEIFTTQPDAMLENYPDIFEGNGGGKLKLPVYKIDPIIAERCKTDQPQWIVVAWTVAIADPTGKYLYESVLNNFNFDYVYNFFFDPAKVKGQPYKPLRSPLFEEAVTVTEASEASKKNTADKNIHFFEDFSSTGVGKTPIGWKSKLNSDGKNCIVASLNGETGNWVELKGNEALIPSQLKKPLPQNFTLSFDVAVPQNFTWGAKSLKIALSKQKSDGTDEANFILSIRPGYSGGTDGLAYVEAKLPAGFASGSSFTAPGFSVNKDFNKISVRIIKDGEQMEVWVDQSKVAEYSKGVPADMLFNALSFSHGRSDGETEKYYISNIKITKN